MEWIKKIWKNKLLLKRNICRNQIHKTCSRLDCPGPNGRLPPEAVNLPGCRGSYWPGLSSCPRCLTGGACPAPASSDRPTGSALPAAQFSQSARDRLVLPTAKFSQPARDRFVLPAAQARQPARERLVLPSAQFSQPARERLVLPAA